MELTIEQALQKGLTAHQGGDLQEAERVYRAILQTQPAHPDANHNLGIIAVSVNQAEAALPLFKTALEANPKIEQFWLSYLDALIKVQQFEQAKQALLDANKAGVVTETLDRIGEQLMPSGDGKTPSQAQLSSLSECYKSGQYDIAEQFALLLTQEFPSHQFGWKILGALYGQTGRNSEAVNANQTAVELSPQDAEAHNNLGINLKELGRLDEAEASYRQAIELRADFSEAHYNLGNTLKELGRLGDAEASLKQSITLKSDYAEAHNNLGITLKELGQLDEAEASLKQSITLKPDYAEAYNNLGITLQELGRLEEAEASLRQAIVLKPDYAEAYHNLGSTLHKLGMLEEAEVSMGRAIGLKPDFDAALINRWLLLFEKKEFEAALIDADSCSFKGNGFDLVTLYALGRIQEIYKRIEAWSKIDAENISVAAFAAFVAKAEKVPTAYNFCPNPLNFIHSANLSTHLNKEAGTYLTELIGELEKVEMIWEPPGKTTVGGYQSHTGINLFKNPSGKIAQLKAIIIAELKTYYLKFHNEPCSYMQRWPLKNDLFGWHVILKHQGHQGAHIHPAGWLSGVIYLKVVPSLGQDEGAIEFSLNGKFYSDVNSPRLIFQPKPGDIIFFPSSLHHRTIPFTTNTDRIVVSFDLKSDVLSQ